MSSVPLKVCIFFILGLNFAALIFNIFCKYYIYRVSYITKCSFYSLITDGVGIGTVLQLLSLDVIICANIDSCTLLSVVQKPVLFQGGKCIKI